MSNEKPTYICGYVSLPGQVDYPVLIKYNRDLFEYLKSGKKIKVKDCGELFIKEGEPKNEN